MPPVSKKTMRRILPAPPAVSRFMRDVLAASEQDLPVVLQNFNTWSFPKGDLFQWIDVLNRCDSLLEAISIRYHLRDSLQPIPFTALDRKLLISILRFSSFLLDHCANRSLYASGNIINELLGTTEIDVLEEVTRLSLRLAQRANHQRNGRSHFPISQDRLWKLSTSLQHSNKDYSISPVPMTELLGTGRAVQNDWCNMRFTYFTARAGQVTTPNFDERSKSTVPKTFMAGSAVSSSSSHGTHSRFDDYANAKHEADSSDGPSLIEIPRTTINSQPLESLVWDTIHATGLPHEYHFDLMLRVRFCKYVENESKMQQLVNIRVLALASSAYTTPEPVLQAKLLSIEGNIVSQLARMAHPDSKLCHSVRAACLWALEAIAHHRPRLGDVLAALGASISHGPLIYTLRTSLMTIQESPASTSSELVDALMSLLHYLSTTNVAGSMLCSAGLIQLLVQFITEARTGSLRTLVKALNLLDHLVYGFPQAFSIFCESHGVSSLVRRIQEEIVETCSQISEALTIKETNKTDYAMTHERFSLLKTMLKFIVHMMQTSGTADGLRNLIESSLLNSMREIYKHVALFGASIFASTTNILATFIHNEPSSYQILHEAQLPELFLRSVAGGVLPAADVMTAIPNAFGAICLNSQGLVLFNEISPLAEFMKIFVTAKHCEVLRESDIAGLLGTSMDELVRHHPSLKTVVDNGMNSALQSIAEISKTSSTLGPTISAFASVWQENSVPETQEATFVDEDDIKRPIIVLHVDIIARFLEGYLQNPNNSQTFVAGHGVEQLLSFYSLANLPYDFAKSHAALSLSHVLRLACEANSQMLIDVIFVEVSKALQRLELFTQSETPESFFEPYLNGASASLDGSTLVQRLQVIHSLAVLLSDIYASPIVSHARSAAPFYITFTTNNTHAQLLSRLARFHRRIIWEDIKLSDSLSPEWIKATQPKDEDKIIVSPDEQASETSLTQEQRSSSKFRDLKMVRFFLCQISPCIVPFFQGLTKMLCSNRRAADAQHRTVALKVSRIISDTLVDHLQWISTPAPSRSCRQSYHLMILSVVQMLICDERNSSDLMTSLLVVFDSGLDTMSRLMVCYFSELCSLSEGPSDSAAEDDNEAARISGIVQLILYMFQRITSSKQFLESPQTMFLDSKERNKDKPGFFDPKAYLRELRCNFLPFGATLWNKPDFGQIPISIARSLVIILTQCMSEIRTGTELPGGVRADNSEQLSNSDSEISVAGNLLDVVSAEVEHGDTSLQVGATTNHLTRPTTSDLSLQEVSRTVPTRAMLLLKVYKDDLVFELVDLLLATMRHPRTAAAWSEYHLSTLIDEMKQRVTRVNVAEEVSTFKAMSHFMTILVYNPFFYKQCSLKLHESLNRLLALLDQLLPAVESSNDLIMGAANIIMICDGVLSQQDTFHATLDDSVSSTTVSANNKLESRSSLEGIYNASLRVLRFARQRAPVLSILRVMVRLLRKPEVAQMCSISDPLVDLLRAFRTTISDCDQNMKITLMLCIRRLIETPAALTAAFKSEICHWFDSKARSVDIGNYVKQNLPIALKDPKLFLATTAELCCLPKFDSESSLQLIERKKDELTGSLSVDASMLDKSANEDKKHDAAVQLHGYQGSVALLLLELQKTFASFQAECNHLTSPHQRRAGTSLAEESKPLQFDAKDRPEYLYLCFILQCLTELLASYTCCKVDFIRHTEITTINADWSSLQSPMIHFLLYGMTVDYVPVEGGTEDKLWHVVDDWAKSVIVALCADVRDVESDAEIMTVRELTLDILHKGVKDIVNSSAPTAIRYRGFIAYADLVQRLISSTILPSSYVNSTQTGETHRTIAKMMLERNFVGLLTSIVAEVDLRVPASRRVVRAIMRPIRTLTKLANRLGDFVSPKLMHQSHEANNIEPLDFADASNDEANDIVPREDTPDLYRNSALGMFGAELHESDEEIYDSDEDEEMVFYDDLEFEGDGSETGSAVSDEELSVSADSTGHEHNVMVEVILDEEADDTDNSEDESMSEESLSESGLYSDEMEVFDGPGDDPDWRDETGTHTIRSTRMTDQQGSLLQELRNGMSRSISRMSTPNLEPFLDSSLTNDEINDFEELDGTHDGLHDADENDFVPLETHEYAMQDNEEDAHNDQHEWNWTDTNIDDAEFEPTSNNIVNRVWATLATNSRAAFSRPDFDPDIQIFRRPRTSGMLEAAQSSSATLVNPVLSRPTNINPSETSHGDQFSHWIESIEALIGGGAVQLIGDIMRRPSGSGRTHLNGPAVRLEVASEDRRGLSGARIEQMLNRSSTTGTQRQSSNSANEPSAAVSFVPMLSLRRYQDEATIVFSTAALEHVSVMVDSLLNVMRPNAEVESGPSNSGESSKASGGVPTTQRQNFDAEVHTPQAPAREHTEASHRMEIAPPPESQSANLTREIVIIRGQDVDVTGFGIDLEFLEALPEDMREEVLTQHIRERRAASRESHQVTPELSPEFLEALPTDIRAELIQQETVETHREVQGSRLARDESGRPSDMDTASFLATLDPALRRAILAEQDDDFLEQLPRDMVNEIVVDRARDSHEPRQHNRVAIGSQHPAGEPESVKHMSGTSSQKQNSVQLLDRQGISALLKLLFQPTPPQRNMLHDTLLNLCSNRNNRTEILSQILGLAIDSTNDMSSIGKSLLSLVKRSKIACVGDTPSKSTRKFYSGVSMISISPSLFLFQCLQALIFLITWNEQTPSFFLTEQDVLSSRRSLKLKGKSKDTLSRASRYPINAIMALMDRPYLLTDADLLESLSLLLSLVTRPLLLLLRNRREEQKTSEHGDITSKLSHAQDAQGDGIIDATSIAMTSVTTGSARRRELVAPEVPRENLRLVINLITADACSGKTFQHTLATIYHLSVLKDAKNAISEELVRQGSGFVPKIQTDLDQLTASIITINTPHDLKRSAMANFSTGNSEQAKFLRVLKTIDYLHDDVQLKVQSGHSEQALVSPELRKVDGQLLYQAIGTNGIWTRLSNCLTVIHKKQDMTDVATLLLPLIEALLVVCKNASTTDVKSQTSSAPGEPDHRDLQQLFIAFTDEHKKVLNQMVRNNPGLMSGSFALLTKNPRVLEFDNKRSYFNRRLRDKGHNKQQHPSIQLNVRREAVFLDSYKDLHFKSGNEVKFSKLNIRFVGEEGVDAGGVSREWFQVLARQMFDPNYALFVPVNADRNTYHPNKTSGINPEHLLFFKFIGRIVGKALYDGRLLDCHFSRPIYCNMLGKNVSLKDMETLDLEYYKSLVWMANNDITDVITESFAVEREDFGEVNVIDLIPNGRNISVNEQNKQEYITRVTEYRLLESVSDQLKHFMTGFNEIIPAELVSIFNEQELELLISGLPDIDPDDWKNNTDYHNYTAGSAQIQWFWRAVRSFDDEERARLLQFCTGSSRIPIEGFANLEGMHGVQKFNIHRDYTTGSRLPQSHTCFNQLDLPEYENYEVLRSSLLTAISEGSEGFGFA